MPEAEIWRIALATGSAAIVCFFTAMTGSGSALILVPLLTFLGLHPVQAVAVHKFEVTFWTATSSFRYWKNGQVRKEDIWWYIILGGFGAFLGARYIHLISDDALRLLIGFLILGVATWIVLMKKPPKEHQASPWKRVLLIGSMIVFGIYEGIFGGGNGFFITVFFLTLVGGSELKTVGMVSVIAVVWNLIAMLTYAAHGSLVLSYAIPVTVGASIGAWFGSGFAIRKGTKVVRWIIIAAAYISGVLMLVL